MHRHVPGRHVDEIAGGELLRGKFRAVEGPALDPVDLPEPEEPPCLAAAVRHRREPLPDVAQLDAGGTVGAPAIRDVRVRTLPPGQQHELVGIELVERLEPAAGQARVEAARNLLRYEAARLVDHVGTEVRGVALDSVQDVVGRGSTVRARRVDFLLHDHRHALAVEHDETESRRQTDRRMHEMGKRRPGLVVAFDPRQPPGSHQTRALIGAVYRGLRNLGCVGRVRFRRRRRRPAAAEAPCKDHHHPGSRRRPESSAHHCCHHLPTLTVEAKGRVQVNGRSATDFGDVQTTVPTAACFRPGTPA